VTTPPATVTCRCCGYPTAPDRCAICGGEGRTIGRRRELHVGRRNGLLDLLRGLDDVRRAVFAMLFEREFIGLLRLPVAMNALAVGVAVLLGWFVLLPAFVETDAGHGGQGGGLDTPHLWLIASWLTVGPVVLDTVAGWAQTPLRRATEKHMLGATVVERRPKPRLLERLQLLLVSGMALPLAMAAMLLPWVGFAIALVIGAVVAAIVWLQAPLAERGLTQRQRFELLRRNPWRAFGTGLGLQMLAGIPFANLLALEPIAAIAGTSAFLQFDKGAANAEMHDPTAAA